MSTADLHRIEIGQTTEACPKMRRRFKLGAAADFAAWLLMIRNQYEEQANALPRTVDGTLKTHANKMRDHCEGMVALCNTLAGRVSERFSVHQWNRAAEQFTLAVDPESPNIDTAACQVAYALDHRDREDNSNG